jgi:ferredoxin
MAHQAMKSAYSELVERLNQSPQGVAPKELLFQILKMLFTEEDAALCARLPIQPFSIKRAAGIWNVPEAAARRELERLAESNILLDFMGRDGNMKYILPPPVAGFFEFSMMRIRNDIDQKLLAELLHKYITEEDDFLLQLFGGHETQFGRMLVHEPALSEENALHVLDYERATHIIKSAKHIGVGLCYCRHKASHKGIACNAPLEFCLSLNTCADSLIRHGCARRIDAAEGLDILARAWDMKLVQFAENNRRNVSFICNCCPCCCDTMIALRRFGIVQNICTNFIAAIDSEKCTGCGKCVQVCPVEAVKLASAHDSGNPNRRVARQDEKSCLGCGVCVRACPKQAIRLESRPNRIITPVDSVHRMVVMAIERGKLQNLIFDNPFSTRHRALAAIIGVILRLPPVKQVLANKQLQSRYLEGIFVRKRYLE